MHLYIELVLLKSIHVYVHYVEIKTNTVKLQLSSVSNNQK